VSHSASGRRGNARVGWILLLVAIVILILATGIKAVLIFFPCGDRGVFLFLPFFPSPPELRLLLSVVLIRDFLGTYRKLRQSIVSIVESVAPPQCHVRLEIHSAPLRLVSSIHKATDRPNTLKKDFKVIITSVDIRPHR
jgi:hypothetical protein